MNNKFSLIMPTLNRKDEVELFLKSLEKQTYTQFELIVVDQNDDSYIKNLCEKFNDKYEIKYIKSSVKGLSVNRNKGIELVTGNIIAFPDDDCEYEIDTLEKVDSFFSDTKYNLYSCKVIDKVTKQAFGKSSSNNCTISYSNCMKNCISISIFIKYINLKDIHFDERLGVGTYFASGEESDLVFSLLHKKYKGIYYSNHFIYHPYKINDYNRVKGDSLGLGALMKKEIVIRKNIMMIPFFFSRIIRPIIGYMLIPAKKEVYKCSFFNRIKGFVEYI